MINTLSKINLSKIGWEGGRSTSIWIMSLNILFFLEYPSAANSERKQADNNDRYLVGNYGREYAANSDKV